VTPVRNVKGPNEAEKQERDSGRVVGNPLLVCDCCDGDNGNSSQFSRDDSHIPPALKLVPYANWRGVI
jgi:hypothetical protein